LQINIRKDGKALSALREYGSYFVAAALLLIIAAVNPRFVSPVNLSNIMSDMSAVLLLAIGVTFVLLVGSIDLSVGAMSSCSCVIFAVTVPLIGWAALFLALLFGAAAGLISGSIYVKFKIPSFIATFGTMSVWQSVALIIAGGTPRQIAKDNWEYIQWLKIKIGIVPLPFLLTIIVFAALIVVEKRTKFGRTLFAVGGNESAARMAGLNVEGVKILVFVVMGLFSALAGILFAANLKSGIPTVGEPFTLTAIAAVVLGGTSMSGGKGGLHKTLAGVILVILIQNGMNVVGVGIFWQKITFGLIILAALWVTADRKRRNLIIK
jgi:ribose/xylose/arabinose/galactoside ABC-type transport system permease subunit